MLPPHRPPLPTFQRTNPRPLAHGNRGRAALALVYHRPINSNIMFKNLIHKVVLLGHSVSSIPCPRKLGPIYSLQKAIAVRASLEAGNGVLKTARERGVGTSVVQRIKAELRGDAHI